MTAYPLSNTRELDHAAAVYGMRRSLDEERASQAIDRAQAAAKKAASFAWKGEEVRALAEQARYAADWTFSCRAAAAETQADRAERLAALEPRMRPGEG